MVPENDDLRIVSLRFFFDKSERLIGFQCSRRSPDPRHQLEGNSLGIQKTGKVFRLHAKLFRQLFRQFVQELGGSYFQGNRLTPDAWQLRKHVALAPAQPEATMVQPLTQFGNVARAAEIPAPGSLDRITVAVSKNVEIRPCAGSAD